MVTRPLVPRNEFLAHGFQHAGQLRGILHDRLGHFVHACPGFRVRHRHGAGDGVDQTSGETDLEVGVERERVGHRATDLITEQLLQLRSHPLLQCVGSFSDRLGELLQHPDDPLDLALEVRQHRLDVVGDFSQDPVPVAGEDTFEGVEQAAQRQSIQQSADRILSLLHTGREILDRIRSHRCVLRQA
ncbi:hypothetical protein ACWDTP_06235 [Mycobacterium sp. NPDC003449]